MRKLAIILLGSAVAVVCIIWMFKFNSAHTSNPNQELVSHKERTIDGQVFIVTQGSENVKLGLVEVSLLNGSEVERFLRPKANQLTNDIGLLEQAVLNARATLRSAQQSYTNFLATNAVAMADYHDAKSDFQYWSKYKEQLERGANANDYFLGQEALADLRARQARQIEKAEV
jgi:hypothetical protein